MKKAFFILSIFSIGILNAQNQNLPSDLVVRGWADYLAKYDSSYESMINDTESITDPTARAATRELEIDKIRKAFIKERTEEFESKKYISDLFHECSNGGGSTKNCGWERQSSPDKKKIYTSYERLDNRGKKKRLIIDKDGSRVNLLLTKSGKGTDNGHVKITWVYRPDFITNKVQDDLNELWKAIIAS